MQASPANASPRSAAAEAQACFRQACANLSLQAAARSSKSLRLSVIAAAAMFSSRCSTDEVPGMGSTTGDRASSHASASWPGVAWCSEATSATALCARGERVPGQESDAQRIALVEHRLGGAIPEVVAVLDRDDLSDGQRPVELFRVDVGQADVPDLSLVLELCELTHRFLKRNHRVWAVELVEVDPFQPQSLETAFQCLSQMARPAVGAPEVRPI